MKIRYTGSVEELYVAPANKEGFTVTRLKWVDVDAEVGASLLEQGEWEDDSKKAKASTEKEK